MKRIDLFIIPLLVASFVVAMTSCTNEGKSELAKENSALIIQDLKFELPDDFFVTTYNLDEVNLSDLITSLNKDLYEEPYEVPYELNEILEEKNLTADEISVYVGYNLNIDGNTNTVTLTPVMDDVNSNDQNCGDKDGNAWISYEICADRECVDEKSNQAVQEFASQLSLGKCLDIRVQRNRTNGRVCTLLTDCSN